MNINFNNNPITTVRFRDILTGECFVTDFNTPNQTICMKTYNGDIEGNANAVDLRDGENYNFEDDAEVVPLNAELEPKPPEKRLANLSARHVPAVSHSSEKLQRMHFLQW